MAVPREAFPMFDLHPIPLTLLSGQLVEMPPSEAQEPQISAESFAALLSARLDVEPGARPLADAMPGKPVPPAGKGLPPDSIEVAGTAPAEGEGLADHATEIPAEALVAVEQLHPEIPPVLLAAAAYPSASATDAHEPREALPQSARLPQAAILPEQSAATRSEVAPNLVPIRQHALPAPVALTFTLPPVAPEQPNSGNHPRAIAPLLAVSVAAVPTGEMPGAVPLAEPARAAPNLPANASPRALAVQAALAAGTSPARSSAPRSQPKPTNDGTPSLPVASSLHEPAPVVPVGKPWAPAPVSPEQPAVPASPLPASLPPEPAAPLSAAPAPPRTDFAGIVDRLIEAREALGAPPVRIALDHAEFGRISLDFRQADSGLSVAMSSADPDFSRAASAALLPPVASADQPQTHAETGQPRREGGQAPGADSSGQQRPAPERRAEDQRPRQLPGQARQDPERPHRGGIFA